MRKWLDYHGAGHLRGHSCEDTLCESGLTTSPQGVSEPSVARMSQAKVAGPHHHQGIFDVRVARMPEAKVA